MNHIRKIVIILWMSIIYFNINAQISSPNRFYEETTAYPNGNDDPIFYFTDINAAQLTATATVTSTFSWYSYSTSSGNFDVLVQTKPDVISSDLTSVQEKGYRVQIDDGAGNISNYYCWAFVPLVTETSISIEFESCLNLRQLASSGYKNLVYYNHKDDKSTIAVDYGFIYMWSSIPDGPIKDEKEQSVMIDAPTEDTDYTVSISNKFALTSADATNSYISIAVIAVFTWEPLTNADNEAKEGSTPMVVRFHADEYDGEILSKGKITDWEWTFGEAGKDFVPNPIFTFQKAGEYPVSLTVRDIDSGCEHQSDIETFKANEMVVKAPNAFTPFSSPGENDEFRVLYRSVKKFNMLIYNRWGRRVYSTTNPAEGWNGRISGRKAEPGVYFYTIEAEGYNPNESIQLEGAVHLVIN